VSSDGNSAEQRWLFLIHQLPSKPAYFRVKIWRRLQGLGAIGVKGSVYALPATAETQEDFEWLLKEIVEGGGEAMVCEARLIDGLSDAQARAMFDAARDADYEQVAGDARALLAGTSTAETGAEARAQVARLRKRLATLANIDFFGATGRLTAEALVALAEARLKEDDHMAEEQPTPAQLPASELKGRTWVTREGVYVDRIGCCWLIRRFIDSDAVFRFVQGKGYVPNPGDLRFDMFEGEITHEGDRCSFEVLLGRAGIADPALQAIAEIVHDIDLKDSKFGREETAGVASLLSGVVSANANDEKRVAQGEPIFDNLYQYFRSTRER
jgi:hypothetical protein